MPKRLKRRPFLKTVIAALAGLPFASSAFPKTRQYIQGPIPRSEVIGLRFEWKQFASYPNPFPGKDWQIVRELEAIETVFDVPVCNYLRNKFIAIPEGETWPINHDKAVLVCFSFPEVNGQTSLDLLECQDATFYKV